MQNSLNSSITLPRIWEFYTILVFSISSAFLISLEFSASLRGAENFKEIEIVEDAEDTKEMEMAEVTSFSQILDIYGHRYIMRRRHTGI